jgi:hypothetical protein
MKYLSILIIVLILVICLFFEKKPISEKFANGRPDMPTINRVVQLGPKKIVIEWSKPTAPATDPINQYMILIKKNDKRSTGMYMNFYNNTDCEKCKYTIENINLEPATKYIASVIAINYAGSGEPSVKYNFITDDIPIDENAATTNTPSITPANNSELMRLGESVGPSYQDQDLANMISRANGIYELNTEKMEYPNAFLSDVKDSINTLNDQVKGDLQEYRMNIHLSGSGSTSRTSAP